MSGPLEFKENESRYSEEKEETSVPDVSKDQKICKVTKSKVKTSKKENFSDGNQAQLQKRTLRYTKGLEKEWCPREDVASCQFTERFFDPREGGVVGEHTSPLSNQENVSRIRPVPLGDECCLTPNRDKAEEKYDGGISEEQQKKPVDFATVTIAEFGITQESFTKQSIGKSPNLLKYRRRSAIGVRGSPENNSLILYLAQQRSSGQKEASAQQVSPFRHENVRSLKDKIDAFRVSFGSVQEARRERGFSGLSQVDDAPQETGSYLGSGHTTKGIRSNAISDVSRKKVSFVEELSLEVPDESNSHVTPPATLLQRGNVSLHTPSGSLLRSILKKTPTKQPMDSMEEYSSNAIDTERHSSEKPEKKRVTFGVVLSPEIFDGTLPANTPLCRGATPDRHSGLQSDSPFTRSSLIEEPLPHIDFDCNDECEEPLQELMEGPVAAEDLLPVENAEAETDKSEMVRTRSSTKRKHSTISEGTDFSISRATNTKNAKDTKNPRKNKFQRQKNTTTSAAKKPQKIKHTNYGKRRKKKVKKCLYGEREIASKKPILSPIPEIPEILLSVSSPDSPKANAFFSEDVFLGNTKSGNACKDVQQKPVTERKNICAVPVCSSSKDLQIVEAITSDERVFQPSDGDLESVSGIDHKFSSIVPDTNCDFDTTDYFQQGEETACVKEAKESGSWVENEKLQGNFMNKAEQLTGQEFLEHQDTGVHEGAQGTWSPQKDSVIGSPPRRRRSSAIYFPPVENLEITGNNIPAYSFNVEEVLSVPQLKNDSLGPSRRKSNNGGVKRVRRSMRLSKDAEIEGLAWIQVLDEIQKKPPLLASASKIRRTTISTSILRESENIRHREQQNLTQCSVPGKENNDSIRLSDGPCKKWRRKSMCVPIPQETGTSSRTRRRSITNSVHRKDRNNQNHYEDIEIPLENNSNI